MRLIKPITALLLVLSFCLPVHALDDAHWKKADQSIDKGIAYLRTQQAEDGSWMNKIGPAVTGLALNALLNQPEIGPDDPAAAKAIAYILKNAQADGSIRNGPDGILPSYNTALCLSALAPVRNDPKVAEVIKKGQDYLKGSQWIIGMTDPNGKVIDEKHPFVGGFGYGKYGRPDISNTQMALQALHDTGVDCEDPVFQRALTFLNNLQATEGNDLYKDKFEKLDGGFIYAPSVNSDNIDKPESKANQDQIDEAKLGRDVSGLRTYGSVTYAGFKSMVYANLDRDDKRIVAALDWISNNYKFDSNPGLPEAQKQQGLFYYYITMARALNAYGSSTIEVKGGKRAIISAHPEAKAKLVMQKLEELTAAGHEVSLTTFDEESNAKSANPLKPDEVRVQFEQMTVKRDWENDLVAAITAVQDADGSWTNQASRWMEDQPILVTAYSVIALQNATD